MWRIRLLVGMHLVLAACSATVNSTGSGPSDRMLTEDRASSASSARDRDRVSQHPYFRQVIESLLSSESVIPDAPPVHPLTATYNREAVIPPMCYTRTEGKFNPCYVCHQDRIVGRENTMNDGDLQKAYSFSDLGMTNHWANLFEDRSKRVAEISDVEIIDWINQDNYSQLAGRLREAGFRGWVPDLEGIEDGARQHPVRLMITLK